MSTCWAFQLEMNSASKSLSEQEPQREASWCQPLDEANWLTHHARLLLLPGLTLRHWASRTQTPAMSTVAWRATKLCRASSPIWSPNPQSELHNVQQPPCSLPHGLIAVCCSRWLLAARHLPHSAASHVAWIIGAVVADNLRPWGRRYPRRLGKQAVGPWLTSAVTGPVQRELAVLVLVIPEALTCRPKSRDCYPLKAPLVCWCPAVAHRA